MKGISGNSLSGKLLDFFQQAEHFGEVYPEVRFGQKTKESSVRKLKELEP